MTRTIVASATREIIIGFDQPFCVIGERINPTGRKKLAAAFKGKELDPDILSAMQLLRSRKATKADDIEHWKFLYTSIENSFKG